MPKYRYKALSVDGLPVDGVIEAYDEFEAVDTIKQSCSVVTSIHEIGAERKINLNMTIGSPKVKEKLLALMCSQFAILLRAGMPIVHSVELIAAQTTDKPLKKLLEQVAEDVGTGYGLAQSFENKGAKMLPTTFIETIRAGEESGTIEVSFAKLHVYFERSSKTKSKVKSAMMYPAFLAVLAVVVIAIIMVFAMPTFLDMFRSMDMELPGITQFLMGVSEFFSSYWILVFAIVIALIVGIKLWSNTESGRMFFAKLALKLPVIKNVSKMKGASQFANTMSTLLSSGLSIVRATTIVAKVLDNYFLATSLGATVASLEEGRPLGYCLAQANCFPSLLVEMTAVGEETGALEETLVTMGEYFDAETEVATQRALSALQPAITIVMGVVIGFVVIALYLPMFSMYGGM